MAVLDLALMLVASDEEPQPSPAVAQELPSAPTDAAAFSPPVAPMQSVRVEPSDEAAGATPANETASTEPTPAAKEPAVAEDASPAKETASTEPAPAAKEPAVAQDTRTDAGPVAAAAVAEKPVEPAPPLATPLPQPIPAVATLPSPPAISPPAELEPAIVLPSAKPHPPAAASRPRPVRRAAPHAHRVQEPPPPQRGNLVQAAAPQALEPRRDQPPPCKPYTAETTLAGEARPVRGIACPEANGVWRIVTERASLD